MYGNKTNWISKKKRLLRKEYSVINKTKRNPESVFYVVCPKFNGLKDLKMDFDCIYRHIKYPC